MKHFTLFSFLLVTLFVMPGRAQTIVINEIQPSNTATYVDEQGEHDDWVELYNASSGAIDIAGWYVSDDYTAQQKFQIASGDPKTNIPSHGFLVVWCDDAASVPGTMHAPFKLSAGGERFMISDGSSTVIDSVSFGAVATDSTYGRSTDAATTWKIFGQPTPNASNGSVSTIARVQAVKATKIYPNPAEGFFSFNESEEGYLHIYNAIGQEVKAVKALRGTNAINISGLNAGFYTAEFKGITTNWVNKMVIR